MDDFPLPPEESRDSPRHGFQGDRGPTPPPPALPAGPTVADRVAYIGQWLRLTDEEAAERVRLRDARRAEFLATHFHHQPGEPHQYDLLLNSSLLGEELCADLVAGAARAKGAARFGAG